MKYRLGLLLGLAAVFALGAGAAELKPLPPRPAPALELPLYGGGRTGLGDLKGKVVLVNFWATWCPPCRKEMPSMGRLANRLADRPFAVLALSVGDSPELIADFLRQVPLAFPIAMDPEGRSLKDWQVFVFPTSYLLDKEGRIRYGLTGSIEWDAPEALQVVEGLLAEQPLRAVPASSPP